MANIKLYPEDSIFIPGKGLEKELVCIIQEYANVLKGRGVKPPFNFDAFSKFNKDFEKVLDDTYDYITNAANDGDCDDLDVYLKIDNVEIQHADNASNRNQSSITSIKDIVSRIRYNGTNSNS